MIKNNFQLIKSVSFSLFLILCLTTLSPDAKAQKNGQAVSLPNTPAANRLNQWLTVRNKGDFEAIRQFFAANMELELLQRLPAETRAANIKTQFHVDGKLHILKIESSGAQEISVLARTELTELWTRVAIKVTGENPDKISDFVNAPAAPPEDEPKLTTDAQMLKWLDGYVEKLSGADAFSGTVLVGKGDRMIFKKAVGLASRSFNAPNRIDTKFNLGSMNKMFTAIAVARLAEKGKLSFEDTVGKHLPDYPNKDVREKVKIHHLLTHTGGISDYFTPKYFETSKERFKEIKDFLPLFSNESPQFEPGTKWDYSNGGFMLLGAIVERVSGQNYFDYVRENVYRQANMPNTDSYELNYDTTNLALGYTMKDENDRFLPGSSRANNLFSHVVKGGPAGGGYSTAPDLFNFARSLKNYKLLSPESTKNLLAGKAEVPGSGGKTKYAYGFYVWDLSGKRIVGHAGGFLGVNSWLDVYLDDGYTVIIMSNYDPPIANRMATKLRQVIGGIK